MNFISIEFLLFFSIILFLYGKVPPKMRWILLLVVSYFFYIYWNGMTVFLLLGMTVFTFLIAKSLEKDRKRGWLILAIVGCLGTLFLFKYFNFFTSNIENIWRLFGRTTPDLSLNIILPVGISFYTFQTMSYVIDVYRGERKPEKNFGYYALYVSFFPQLVAGPIERSERLLPQLSNLRKATKKEMLFGLLKMLVGFLKKIVIADYFGQFVDQVYQNTGEVNGPGAVVATILFAFQIYCDFSGYSDIAVGAAQMLGIHLMENFNRPYLAKSVREFWRRWHISLTSWFTDYVYKPLGGSYKTDYRTYLNIMVVFILSGLWHGAGWTFFIWGALHGIYLIFDRILQVKSRIVTFLSVCFAWIFFRANNLKDAMAVVGSLFRGWNRQGILAAVDRMQIGVQDIFRIAVSLAILYLVCKLPIFWSESRKNDFETNERTVALTVFTIFIFVILIAFGWFGILAENAGNNFIYFQF